MTDTTAGTTRRYWSVRAIADRWGCSKGKVYKALASQDGEPPRLASITLDGMVRVRDEDLASYEAEAIKCRTPTGSAGTAAGGSRSTGTGLPNGDVRLLRITRAKPSARSAS